LYKHRHYQSQYDENGYALISIPKHLIADPFEIMIRDRLVDFYIFEKNFYFSSELNQTVVNPFLTSGEPEIGGPVTHTLIRVGPIYDEGMLELRLLGISDQKVPSSIIDPEAVDIVNLQEPGFADGNGSPIDVTEVGMYSTISAFLTNRFEFEIPYTVVAEVRNSDGVTEFLTTVNDTLEAATPFGGGNGRIWIPWAPADTGEYQLRLFLVTSLDNKPQILSSVSIDRITVNPPPEPERPPVPDVARTINIAKSKEIQITSSERNPHGEKVEAIMTVNNVTTHTGDIENLPYKDGFITVFFNYSMENIDNYAYYAEQNIEAIVDGDSYPPQLTGGGLGSVLLPNEKRDSFVAIQVIDSATEVTFHIKDMHTRETLWQIAVSLKE
jgi:hypothetical protein